MRKKLIVVLSLVMLEIAALGLSGCLQPEAVVEPQVGSLACTTNLDPIMCSDTELFVADDGLLLSAQGSQQCAGLALLAPPKLGDLAPNDGDPQPDPDDNPGAGACPNCAEKFEIRGARATVVSASTEQKKDPATDNLYFEHKIQLKIQYGYSFTCANKDDAKCVANHRVVPDPGAGSWLVYLDAQNSWLPVASHREIVDTRSHSAEFQCVARTYRGYGEALVTYTLRTNAKVKNPTEVLRIELGNDTGAGVSQQLKINIGPCTGSGKPSVEVTLSN